MKNIGVPAKNTIHTEIGLLIRILFIEIIYISICIHKFPINDLKLSKRNFNLMISYFLLINEMVAWLA